MQISSVSLGGSSASEFSLSSNCTAPLAPAASCSVSLVFSPVAAGQSAAMLTVADDAPGSPQSASISAAVAAFSVAPASGSSTTASVSAGQSAQYQLQLTPGPGFTGAVSLSCTGAPLGAVCQVPASVSLASGPATVNVTVTTSGPAQMLPSTPPRVPILRVPLASPTFVALLFFLLAFLSKNRRTLQPVARKNRLALCGLLSAAIFCITFALTGCGGGSSASVTTPLPPPVITPSGTSTITISLSATS